MAKNTPAKKTKKPIKVNWKLIGKVSLITLIILLTLLIISLPIYYYWKDFHEFNRSDNPNDWGTFGDFFGGILNPFISLLTLIVTIIIAVNISRIEKRNHDETVHSPVKPLFTIGAEEFFSADISHIGLSVEKDFYDYLPPEQPAGQHDYLSKSFYLKVFNKGLGIATEINVTFEMQLNELQKELVIDNPNIKVTSSDIITDEEGRDWINLTIKSTPYNYHGSLFKIWAKERFGLDPIDKGEKAEVRIPSQMMGAFQVFRLIQMSNNRDENFPTIFLTFNYKNIHGKPLTSKFRVALLHIHNYGPYSRFRIIYDHI